MKLKSLNCSVEAALETIEQSEDSVKKACLEGRVTVDMLPKGAIGLSCGGKQFVGFNNPALIHQFGSRLWHGRNLEETLKLWQECNPSELSHRLGKALSGRGDLLRYKEDGGVCRIYGLTSSHFLEVKQSHFRSALIGAFAAHGITPEIGSSKTPYGEIVEKFTVPDRKSQVGLSCRVIYGLNNGYSSYRLSWGRVVLVCSNGLTQFQATGRNRWFHDDKVKISDFVRDSTEEARQHLSTVERQIADARSRAVNHAKIDHFLTRLSVAAATKERVVKRVDHEVNDTGRNDWSISQALTFLGEHEKAIPLSVREDLTRVGSNLLERSLDQVIDSPTFITTRGYYDIIR